MSNRINIFNIQNFNFKMTFNKMNEIPKKFLKKKNPNVCLNKKKS